LCADENENGNMDTSLDVIHTPGYTPGSVSVRLRTDQGVVFFTGDTAFTQRDMSFCRRTTGV